jgi:hypothetical protein
MNILAGTATGLYLLKSQNTYKITGFACEISDIAKLDSSCILAAVSKSSGNDGIYLGKPDINGPPFYTLKQVVIVENPQKLLTSKKYDTLYIAVKNGILRSIRNPDGAYGKPEPIKTPPNCFGVEDPRCSGLIYNSWKDVLASGYDAGANPSPGHILETDGDSMKIIYTGAVNSIDAVRDVSQTLLIGTRDSSLYTYNMLSGGLPRFLGSPARQLVNDLCSFECMSTSTTPVTRINIVVAAVKNGVFYRDMENSIIIFPPIWRNIGNLPIEPLCLFPLVSSPIITMAGLNPESEIKLLAGTGKGVYAYFWGSITNLVGQVGTEIAKTGVMIHSSKTHLTISYQLIHTDRVHLEIFNCSGKLLISINQGTVSAGDHTVTCSDVALPGTGAFILRLRGDDFMQVKRFERTF